MVVAEAGMVVAVMAEVERVAAESTESTRSSVFNATPSTSEQVVESTSESNASEAGFVAL